ncbi:ATP synthase F1 subcomplex gamma subunit [Quadrisphaera granulorum]|uniref:ATP synthase gamma chain n=1 Tax=Quadrisphaera granulorum TaxID=317664 RepID=A0A316AEY3_9ACTN|nr:F0F1 ATP synthase subunit gamma [Quadrisphaera granulorum]PWJ56293.1 ATP synthase F1 subcomplex gamma subunit [Quadrisphaera granulorum]SZE94927.1 ATP synthase F1 subcomplex gamma subunit [Quadrisphaera granulorum]
MAGQLREYRGRIKSTKSIQKIFRAMELIATSRIAKARQAVAASSPYARALTRAVSAVATYTDAEHPLLTERENPQRAAVLVVTSDRGMAGAYSSNTLREAERLIVTLRERGVEPVLYVLGRKGVTYFRFRRRDIEASWTGNSESPTYEIADEVGETLVEAFQRGGAEGGVDEIHIVSTRFLSMVTQEPQALRLLPLEVVEGVEAPPSHEVLPLYSFEPDPETVLDALLPRYISARIFNLLLQASASEHAARQRAMKAAGDNADDIIKDFTRLANQARQAEITQEISEIVSGADAMTSAR